MSGRRELSREEIARRAHELYVQRGGEHGKDVEDWVRAEQELIEVRADKELIDKVVSQELAKMRAAQAGRQAVN